MVLTLKSQLFFPREISALISGWPINRVTLLDKESDLLKVNFDCLSLFSYLLLLKTKVEGELPSSFNLNLSKADMESFHPVPWE